MNIEDIRDEALRAEFKAFCAMSETELFALGLNSEIRDQYVAWIELPEDQAGCWRWGNKHVRGKYDPRPAIFLKNKYYSAYRVGLALRLRKPLAVLDCGLHKCRPKENGWCVNPDHLYEGTRKDNAQDRSRARSLHGDANGTRTRPETRPRGMNHPKSPFKGAEGKRCIQMLRATWSGIEDKRGLIEALVRYSGKSRAAVTNVVKGRCYLDIPDDPGAAVDRTMLQINLPGDSAKKRKKWPSGDSHSGTRMPMAAKRAYVLLFHRIRKVRLKTALVTYCCQRYGLKVSTVQTVGYTDPRTFGAPEKAEIQRMPIIETLDADLLEKVFGGIPPHQGKGGEE